MPLTHLEPDKFYLSISCARCGEEVPFAEAPSPEEQPEMTYRTIPT
jgi:hypothetical protein